VSVVQDDWLLPGFSDSMNKLAAKLGGQDVTAGTIADELLSSHAYYGGPPSSPLAGVAGRTQAFELWVLQIEMLFDRAAVEASPMEVIDSRMTLLALARLEPALGAVLGRDGVRARILRELKAPPEDLFRPWATPQRPSEWVELTVLSGHEDSVSSCAFSPDGSLLATTGRDGTARLWDVASGSQRSLLTGHKGEVKSCAFSPDGSLLATTGRDWAERSGTARLWDVASGNQRSLLTGHEGVVWSCAFSPDGSLLATTSLDGTARLWDVASGNQRSLLTGHQGYVDSCAFSPDGSLLATTGADGTARLWDVASGNQRLLLTGHEGGVGSSAFSPDGSLLATTGFDGTARLWDVASGNQRSLLTGLERSPGSCTFSPDGSLLATTGLDGTARLWDVASGNQRSLLTGHQREVVSCAFSPDGSLLATTGRDGTVRLWDVASGSQRSLLTGHEGVVWSCAFSSDGSVLVTRGIDGTARLWEQILLPPLPQVRADTAEGEDLLDVRVDAEALANVVAATGTRPPLSIGLFGDWGSGKTFFIRQVQRRVRRLARASRLASRSEFCRHVRNIEFNAWHYADANLWAALVTHIFDELGRPEPQGEEVTPAQAARLWQELAANSALQERLRRAEESVRQLEARRKLAFYLALLGGWVAGEQTVGELSGIVGTAKTFLPRSRSWILIGLPAALIGAVVWLVAPHAVWPAVSAFAVTVGAAFAGLTALLAGPVRTAGETVKLDDVRVRREELDAQLDVARKRERELREEIADLASGRGLARLVAERGRDYRGELGLVSRIREDFEELQSVLNAASDRERETVAGAPADRIGPETPPVDRIVLYIDDLDRCPPKRVVEVLEAVHLLLALPLFVVVVAVDPRWLLQSLRLHYSELLASSGAPPGADGKPSGDEDAWLSTPGHYLEKIIQVPFTLRPLAAPGVARLVASLLPEAPAATAHEAAAPTPVPIAAEAPAELAPGAEDPPDASPRSAPAAESRPAPSLDLSPRTLGATAAEREFAARVACFLETPRAVKKFTNLYRLVRARLDEDSGQLDRFLETGAQEVPDYQAVLLLLAVIVAFPDDASTFLLDFGDLTPGAAPDAHPWTEHVDALMSRRSRQLRDLCGLVSKVELTNAATSTREPFRRWALEVSRYSFTTGQEVFARFGAGATDRHGSSRAHVRAWNETGTET
jgi:WD40 repeat protein